MIRRRAALASMLGTLAGILILASGCVDQTPTELQLRPANAVLAAKAYTPGTYVAQIGPDGGTLDFGIGKIEFPAGALSSTETIRATVDGKTIGVEFGPHGLVFPEHAQPALVFDLANARVGTDRLLVYYVDDSGTVLETYAVHLSAVNGTATTYLRHFSKLILGHAT